MTKRTERIFNKIKKHVSLIAPKGDQLSIVLILKEKNGYIISTYEIVGETLKEIVSIAETKLKEYGKI